MKHSRRIITLVLIPVIAFACLELFMRYELSRFQVVNAAALDVPAGYAHSPFWSSAFESELTRFNSGFFADDNGFSRHPDFQGRYFNVVNGWRATTNQPLRATHTIWLFGSSTVYGYGLPDADTIASALQRLVGKSYRVENRGMNTIDISKERILLNQTNVRPGDIVILYDGFLDAITPRRIAINRKRLEPSLCHAILPIMNWSLLVRVSCTNDDEEAAPDATLLADTAQGYAKSIVQARIYTLQHGAAFYHFLQPSVYIDMLSDEQQFAMNTAVMSQMWPLLQSSPYTIDLSRTLDPLRRTNIIWLDDVHTNERGNAVIARAIYAALWQTF